MLINDIKFITVAFIRYQNTQPIINGAKMVHVHANMFVYVKSSMKEKLPIDNLLYHQFILQE